MPSPKDSSRVDPVGRAYAGSQRQIQAYMSTIAVIVLYGFNAISSCLRRLTF
jgi:hypothetical protein